VFIESPEEGTILATSEVTFVWRGGDDVRNFTYRLDDEEWSPWTVNTRTTVPCLDEGSHTFWLAGQYPDEGAKSDTLKRTFTVDAVKGPAIRIRPMCISASLGEEFEVEVIAEEVTDLMLAHIVMTFDPSVLEVLDVSRGDFLATNVALPDTILKPVVFLEKSDYAAGRIDISTGVAIGDPPGVNGTGQIARITFRARSTGKAELGFAPNTEFRNQYNVQIGPNVKRTVEVEVK